MNIIRLQITCASPGELLDKLAERGLTIRRITPVDLLNVQFDMEKSQLETAKGLFRKYGVKYKRLNVRGWLFFFLKLWKRPVLLAGFLVLFALTLYLPSRILFCTVKGNTTIPARYIIEKAAAAGIRFGALRSEVRNEKVKNRLLSEIPELQWVGVNTYGCFAVISVEEKVVNKPDAPHQYNTNIVASQDAIITDLSVLRGVALCKAGDAVKKGQIMISGYSDVGLCVRLTGADGEVNGYTQRSLSLKTPAEYTLKGKETKIIRRYSIIFGKKLINFDKGSGISGVFCDRMYSEYYLVLPGGLQLPVGIAEETIICRETKPASHQDAEAYQWMDFAAEQYLTDQMVAGKILRKDIQLNVENEYCCFYGVYRCHELIGQIHYEEMLQQYE